MWKKKVASLKSIIINIKQSPATNSNREVELEFLTGLAYLESALRGCHDTHIESINIWRAAFGVCDLGVEGSGFVVGRTILLDAVVVSACSVLGLAGIPHFCNYYMQTPVKHMSMSSQQHKDTHCKCAQLINNAIQVPQ